jgi:hypothetical protein
MAERKNKLDDAFLGIAIVIAGIAWIAGKVTDTIGVVTPIVIVVLLVVCFAWHKRVQRRKRIEYLFAKYGDQAIVDCILRQQLWQGETAPQLLDSIGSPFSIDRRVMATRKREIWKYNRTGRGRYGLRITLDNDVVIEIDQKTS